MYVSTLFDPGIELTLELEFSFSRTHKQFLFYSLISNDFFLIKDFH